MGKSRYNHKQFDEYDDDFEDVKDRKKQDAEMRHNRGKKERDWFESAMKYEDVKDG